MTHDARARWMEAYVSGSSGGWGEVPAVPGSGWGRPPPSPPLRRPLVWQLDYFPCVLIVYTVWFLAFEFRGSLLYDEYSVVNVLALILTRMHMLVIKSSPAPSSWTALALLPTCPAPALSTPPVCYDWEKPAAAMVLPGSSGSADRNWRSDEHDGDYMAGKKCFDSLLRDAVWTCEQEDDYKAAMKCFDSLVRDAARICFVRSYDAVPQARQLAADDAPPT